MSTDEAAAERDVRRLIHAYARGADRCDGALIRSIFADDAEIDMGAIYRGGPDGFVTVVLEFMGAMAATRHVLGNMYVVFDHAAAATMESYVTAWHRLGPPGGTRVLEVLGRYLTRAERRDGRWLVTRHSELIDWGEERAASADWFDGNAELEKGRRGRDDASYAWLRPSRDAG